MKILFVKTSIGASIESTFDLGIASISAVLKKNNHLTSFYLVSDWSNLKRLFLRIEDFNPQIICFSSTESTYRGIKKIINLLKKKYPKKIFICGGVHTILSPEAYLKNKEVDGVCLGEGEYSLLALIENFEKYGDYKHTDGFWFRNKKRFVKNGKVKTIIDLDNLPFPDREIFFDEGLLFNSYVGEGKEQTLEFMFSRGCYFNCSYCSNHALKNIYGEPYVRFRSPMKAIREIKMALTKYRAEYLVFHDDSFTVNKKWLNEFLKKYKKIHIPFRCNTRVDLCSKEIFRDLKKAGCECIQFGLESGDFEIRNKILNRQMSDNSIIEAFRLAKKYNIRTGAFVMIGLPNETPEKFIKTIKLVAETDADKYYLYMFRPYKATRLYDYCKKNGLIKRLKKDFIEWQDFVLDLPNFSKEDIYYYYNNFDLLVKIYRKYLSKKSFVLLRKIFFNLHCIPPSKKLLFFFSQLLIKFVS